MMGRVRALILAIGAMVVLLGGFTASAAAEPVVTMSGEGWKARKSFGRTEFLCESDACGGVAVVGFSKTKVLSNLEDEINKPYANVRAIVNGALIYMFDGQDGGIKVSDIHKIATKDYTAIRFTARQGDDVAAVMMIIQGGRAYTIVSAAGTVKQANDNLAKAFKSADFRRPS